MRIMHVADLHLTDRVQDEYRWKIFRWLQMRTATGNYDAIAILGDLTEAKDHHSAALIKRLVEELKGLAGCCPIHIVKGNHDYVDERTPFFQFLQELDNVYFYTGPSIALIQPLARSDNQHESTEGIEVGIVPHMAGTWCRRHWEAVEKVCAYTPLIWVHQTFSGARNEAGHALTGFPHKDFETRISRQAVILSGDVHTPQQIGRVIYVGAPHPVDFGDEFSPRVAVWEDGKVSFIKRSTIKKAVVYTEVGVPPAEVLKAYSEGDRIRVVVDMHRTQLYGWEALVKKYKKHCKKHMIELCGIEPRVKGVKSEKLTDTSLVLNTPMAVLRAYADATKEFDSTLYGYAVSAIKSLKPNK